MTGMDFDRQFLAHLVDKDSFEVFLKEAIIPELLVDLEVRAAWAWAKDYYQNNRHVVPTPEVLFHEFKLKTEDRVSEPKWLTEQLRLRYRRRSIQGVVKELAQLSGDPDAAHEKMRETLFDIETKASLQVNYVQGREDFSTYLLDYQEEMNNPRFKGATLGFEQIDRFTGGAKPGNLIYLCARPKKLKTWFLLKAFVDQIKDGHNPLFFTLELTEKEVWGRIACLVTGVPYTKYMMHQGMSEKEFRNIDKVVNDFMKNRRFQIVRPPIDQRSVSSLMLEVEKYDADSVIIDQFKFLRAASNSKSFGSKWEEHSSIVMDLKLAATRQGREIPIYIAAQLGREAAKKGKEGKSNNPDSSFIGLTREIEETADTLYSLHQTDDMKQEQIITFGIMDARSHDTNKWQIEYDFMKRTELKVYGEGEYEGSL